VIRCEAPLPPDFDLVPLPTPKSASRA
jgi:hypothetical protein